MLKKRDKHTCGKRRYREFVVGMNAMHVCIEDALWLNPEARDAAQRHLSAIHKIVYDDTKQMDVDPTVDLALNGLHADDRVEAIV